MIIILPLVPVLIGVLCIALGLFSEIQSSLNTISIILIVIASLIFLGLAIYNLAQKKSVTNKIVTTLTCIASGVVTSGIILYFMDQLGQIEFGILGLIEFIFVVMVGGGICLAIILGLIALCFALAENGVGK